MMSYLNKYHQLVENRFQRIFYRHLAYCKKLKCSSAETLFSIWNGDRSSNIFEYRNSSLLEKVAKKVIECLSAVRLPSEKIANLSRSLEIVYNFLFMCLTKRSVYFMIVFNAIDSHLTYLVMSWILQVENGCKLGIMYSSLLCSLCVFYFQRKFLVIAAEYWFELATYELFPPSIARMYSFYLTIGHD